MAKEIEHYAKVKFDGVFPIDMLRYEGCWPALETYSGVIEESILNHSGGEIIVTRRAGRSWEWTVDRWHSFGCKITAAESEYLR